MTTSVTSTYIVTKFLNYAENHLIQFSDNEDSVELAITLGRNLPTMMVNSWIKKITESKDVDRIVVERCEEFAIDYEDLPKEHRQRLKKFAGLFIKISDQL